MKTLYVNGSILTMTDQRCEAVLTEGERIIGIGTRADFVGEDAAEYDLRGRTLLPAFLDAHSHLSSYAASFLQASVHDAHSLSDIQRILSDFIAQRESGSTAWVVANGYDDSQISDRRRLDRAVLDEVSRTIPIVVQHKNGHNGVFNSKAIELFGIDTEDGVLEETAYMEYVKRIPMPDLAALTQSYYKAQSRYLRYGITHVQEGILVKSMVPIYQHLVENNCLLLDTVVYPDMDTYGTFKALYPQAVNRYYRHMKIGGIKIILDGSPQSKTAWMKTPYLGTDTFGQGTMTDEAVYAAVEKALAEGVQIIAHCNGDRAVEQYLCTLERFGPQEVRKIRPVIIHAQLLALDQLDRVKALGAIPSFFIAHIHHFGDIHIKNFGMDRASKISPAKSALDKGILFTFHQDTPVIQPDVLETIRCAVNRTTKSGVLLGAEERLDTTEAIRAQTANVAVQYGESADKGSIAVGKLANFVVLNRDISRAAQTFPSGVEIDDVIYLGEPVSVWRSRTPLPPA